MTKLNVLGATAVWALPAMLGLGLGDTARTAGPTEAPTGFLVQSNGFAEEFCANQQALTNSPNSPGIPAEECFFETAVEEFTGPEDTAAGLGPIFNGNGCGECHIANQTLGATSQIVERRAGFWNGTTFTDHPGGSLIQDRAFDPNDQELVIPASTNVIALRSTISVMGDGFVEAIANTTLQNLAAAQPAAQRGQLINVPVLEFPGATRIGRFGHKNQQASLLSFSADAYINEMGITSPLEPNENTSNGRTVPEPPDAPPGVDDEGVDVELFALFMRSTLAPPVDPVRAASADAQAGSTIFNNIGCAVCHTRTIVTAAPGTLINGGAMRVSNALGDKIIHPFADFLLHDVGTGDGIVQNGGVSTRNKIRTAPLWGLRARGRFMHDGLTFSVEDAIARHGGQAATARTNFNNQNANNRRRLIAFLMSL
ncbi:MAG: di-heme oxidoredictase family protein [Vicinamibacteria bacterium]